jgi:membrane fusion protein (multidrug efflux system)
VLPDGTPFAQPGTLDFSDVAVDASTGAVNLRGIVPNSDHKLLPGMYVNVRVTLGELKRAYLVPQAAVLRDAKGPYAYTVGKDGKVAMKRIKADAQQADTWIVTDGIAEGDQIVVSGVQKVKPDAQAKATPWQPNADAAKSAPGAAAAPAADKH